MARTFFWLMLLLNVLYGAWAQGWLLPYGFGPLSQREPQRLTQQIQPQAITLVSQEEARRKPLDGTADNARCLQTGSLNANQAEAVRSLLQATWPPESWQLVKADDGLRLRLPEMNATLQAQLPALKALLPAEALQACAGPGAIN